MHTTQQAGRALVVYLAMLLDQVKYAGSDAERSKANSRVALLTPMAKAFFTDLRLDCMVLGLQVFGRHGYIC